MSEAQAALPPRLGGSLCLDFVNTIRPRAGEERREYLPGYLSLVRWAASVGILDQAQQQRLRKDAARRRADAGATLAAAVDLREAVYRVFAAVAQGSAPAAADLAALQRAYADALRHARIVAAGGELRWAWDEEGLDLDRMLWPVARSAAELATSGQLGRVRQCPVAEGGCGWLFLDTTRNGTRRWCSMQDCGGRAKARRQYARRRAASARAGGAA